MATTSTIAALAPDVMNRLQDPLGIFWLEQFETYAGLAEAISELLLIIGRPTLIYNQKVTLVQNQCYQPMPANVLAILNVRTDVSVMAKTTLHSLDYMCSSWSPSWESDRSDRPRRWAPLGLNNFIVHPAPLQPMEVNINAIQYPILTTWPPSGGEVSPFHKEFDQALELYAASYARVKEGGQDFQEGLMLYQQFLEIAQRATVIEDRKDSLVWTRAVGAATAPSQVSHR